MARPSSAGRVNLVEDAEDLVGIDRAQRQIVVGIAPVVEVEAAQHLGVQQPRHNLLDVLRAVVMAGIHQHARLRAGDCAQSGTTCPSRQCRCDKTPARRACTRPASAGSAPGGRARCAAPPPASRCACGCSACRDSSSRRPSTARCRASPAPWRSRSSPACARAPARESPPTGLHSEPNLYSWSWNRLGLIEPERTPKRRSNPFTSGTSFSPLGRSHSTCRATVGVTPVSRFTSAASANFSSMVVAAAACTNLPKRVPVLANPHEGISIWKESSALNATILNVQIPKASYDPLHVRWPMPFFSVL